MVRFANSDLEIDRGRRESSLTSPAAAIVALGAVSRYSRASRP
jgi:hypothetical protein